MRIATAKALELRNEMYQARHAQHVFRVIATAATACDAAKTLLRYGSFCSHHAARERRQETPSELNGH